MMSKNSHSKRINPFKKIYDSSEYKNVLQNKNSPKVFPFIVDVELTNHCNLDCLFCMQQVMKRPKGFMKEEIFKKIVDECSDFGTPIRLIRFGESTLHPKIIDFCKYAKSKGILLHITSNGFIKESDMQSLIDIGVDSLVFSFQGVTKKEYEIMRNNNRYDELNTNILKIVELRGKNDKPFIHVSSTVTDETKEEINIFVNYWNQIVDFVGIGKTDLSNANSPLVKNPNIIKKLKSIKKKDKRKRQSCTEVYQKLSVDWDGKVTCCCGDYDNFLTVGNIPKTTLYDIWNNSWELKTFRKLLDNNMFNALTLCSSCYHTYEEF